MRYIQYIIALTLFFTLDLDGQSSLSGKKITKEEVVQFVNKISQWYTSTPTYSFHITYSSFAGHTANVAYEQATGYFKKLKEGVHSNIMGLETIQNKNYTVHCDTAQKIITVSEKVPSQLDEGFNGEEYLKALAKCSSAKLTETTGGTLLHMEFEKSHPVQYYEFLTRKEGGLQYIIICYTNEVSLPAGNKVKPKLKIGFSDYGVNITPHKSELDVKKIFSMKNNIIKPIDAFKDYTLLDQRINTNTP